MFHESLPLCLVPPAVAVSTESCDFFLPSVTLHCLVQRREEGHSSVTVEKRKLLLRGREMHQTSKKHMPCVL